MKWIRETRCSPLVRPVSWGTFGVASRVASTVSHFNMECSLETLLRARACFCEDRGTTWFFLSCGWIPELHRGIQASSCVGPRKSNLPFKLRERGGDCARVTAGQKRPHLGLRPGANVPLQGRQASRGCIQESPRKLGLFSWGSEGLYYPLESRRISLGAH